jgi:hypothetical protein
MHIRNTGIGEVIHEVMSDRRLSVADVKTISDSIISSRPLFPHEIRELESLEEAIEERGTGVFERGARKALRELIDGGRGTGNFDGPRCPGGFGAEMDCGR